MHRQQPGQALVCMAALLLLAGGCLHRSMPPTTVSATPLIIAADNDSAGIVATIRLNARRPGCLTVSPDGSRLYVADGQRPATLSVVDTRRLLLDQTVVLDDDGTLNGLAVSPDGSRLYAALSRARRSKEPAGQLLVIDTAALRVVDRVTVGRAPAGVAVSPDGDRVYVVNQHSRTLQGFATADLRRVMEISLGIEPLRIALHPSGRAVYAANIANKSVTVVETASGTLRQEITLGCTPWELAADNASLYVTAYHAEHLVRVDAVSGRADRLCPVGSGPAAIVRHPRRSRLYVTSVGSGTLTAVDSEAGRPVGMMALPIHNPQRMAISPDGSRLYIANDFYHVHVIDTASLEPAAATAPQVVEHLVLEGVWFDFDKARIRRQYVPVLEHAASVLRAVPDRQVLIAGHTCTMGSDAYNLDLSLRRAESVRRYLAAQGVDPQRMQVRAFGERAPLADNADRAGRERNRRVELTIIEPTRAH